MLRPSTSRVDAVLRLQERDPASQALGTAAFVDSDPQYTRSMRASQGGETTLELADGRHAQVHFKFADGVLLLGAMLKVHSKQTAILMESASRGFAVHLGAAYSSLVPPTAVRRGPREQPLWCVQQMREGNGHVSVEAVRERAPQQWRAAALFDFLTGQQDRHPGNYLWEESTATLTLIDHGFSFTRGFPPPVYSRLWRSRRTDPLERQLDADELVLVEQLAADLGPVADCLSRGRRDGLQRRVERLRRTGRL